MDNKEKNTEGELEEAKVKKTLFKKREKYMNTLNMDAKSNLRNRTIVAIALFIIVMPCLIFGNYVFAALILVASIISCHEIINTPQSLNKRFSVILYVLAYIMMVTLIYWIIVKNNIEAFMALEDKNDFYFDLTSNFVGPRISLASFCICIGLFFLVSLLDKRFSIGDAFYFVGMLFLVSIGFQSILYLRYCPFTYTGVLVKDSEPFFKYFQSMLLIFYMLLGTCLNDVGAYLSGILFGKHKMCPRISPKKTWEGFAGGVLLSLTATLIFGFALDSANIAIIPGILDIEHWYNLLILSFMMPIFAVFGDLIFSQIKRFYNIKDFGKALKSHGGILDRLDSILVTSIAMALLIEVMANNWSIF